MKLERFINGFSIFLIAQTVVFLGLAVFYMIREFLLKK